MTTHLQAVLSTPMFRVWDPTQKIFLERVYWRNDNVLFDATKQQGAESGMLIADVEIDLWTGRFTKIGQPVYQGDRVKFLLGNEFGSVTERTGVIRYAAENMCFIIEDDIKLDDPNGREDNFATMTFLEIIGHDHV